MPGYVAVETAIFEDLGDCRTRIVNISLFHTTEEHDGDFETMNRLCHGRRDRRRRMCRTGAQTDRNAGWSRQPGRQRVAVVRQPCGCFSTERTLHR